MHTYTENALNQVDWTAISEGIARWRHQLRTGLWKGAAMGLVSVPFTAVLLRDRGIIFSVFAAVAAVATVLALGRKKQKQLLAELKHAEASDDELLTVYRDQLDREIATRRQDSWVLPLLALLPLTLIDTSNATAIVAVGALMALLFSLGVWVRFSVLPRLLRNREALS